MKKVFEKFVLAAIVLVMVFGLISCGGEPLPEYSLTVPEGYSKSAFLSGGGSDVYDTGLFSDDSNMITVTYYSNAELEEMSGSETVDITAEEFVDIYFDVYFGITGGEAYNLSVYEECPIYEYKDIMDSRGALFVTVEEDGIWTIDFSIDTDKYEAFKPQIPVIITSFKVK